MPIPPIALLLLGGAAVAIASKPSSKSSPPPPKDSDQDDEEIMLAGLAEGTLSGALHPANADEAMIVSIALRPPSVMRPIHLGRMAVAADTLSLAEAITQQTGAPHLTGPSVKQIRDWAYRAILKFKHEGGAKKRIARIMAGQPEQIDHASNIIAHCEAKGINMGMGSGFTMAGGSSTVGYETEATRCAREYMESLPAMDDYEKSRRLWDVIWRYIKKGFYLKKGPEVKPPPEEIEEMAIIIMEAILSEIDPMRAPDPSMGARYAAIKRRAEQVIEWPRCSDSLEGCKAHRERRRKDLANLIAGFSGEERIVRIAAYTGKTVIERTRTLKVNMPTNFGDFLIEVALPAMAAGVGLVIEIWGAIVNGDDIDWSYPENVYGGGEVNEAIDTAKGVYDAAAAAAQEGEDTSSELAGAVETFGASFAGGCQGCACKTHRAYFGGTGGVCCESCASGAKCDFGNANSPRPGLLIAREAARAAIAEPFLRWASTQTRDATARSRLHAAARKGRMPWPG